MTSWRPRSSWPPTRPLTVALLLTSDEEGPSLHGTVHVVRGLLQARASGWTLHRRRAHLGRPRGRHGQERPPRHAVGPAHGAGVQGHIAYPQLARNPIHVAPRRWPSWPPPTWDEGNDHFPPTSWQVSNIHAGTGARQRHPRRGGGGLQLPLLHREHARRLKQRVLAVLARTAWSTPGGPWAAALPHPTPGTLHQALAGAIEAECGIKPSCPPPAAPATAASSPDLPAGDRVRPATPASTRSTSTCGWPTSSR
jgi:succinyl-diaminopimelate desuccinylase